MSAKVARRYSSAWLHHAGEKKMSKEVLRDAELIRRTIQDSREFRSFLKSKIITADKKKAVFRDLFAGNLSDITLEFLEFLTEKGRENLLPEIAGFLISRYNREAGILNVKVSFPSEPEIKQLEQLVTVLEKKTGRKINLIPETDRSLLGGIKVRIDDTVIDGTVKNKLKKLETIFSGTAA